MKQQVLPPGVQDSRNADLRSKPSAVAGQGQQGLGGGLKEQVVQSAGVVEHEGVQGGGQGEDHVEVLYG
jgi:hypothetical protein